MKMSVDLNDFKNAFKTYKRESEFSAAGQRALFEYLEQYEEDTGEEIELDVIALCCDYTENTIEDVLKETGLDSLEELQDNTMVIMVDDNTVIYQNF